MDKIDLTRIDILETAIKLTAEDRAKIYGNAVTNMKNFAALINEHFKTTFSAEDAAMIMVFAKLARVRSGVYHLDNYIDAAAYIAIAGECRIAALNDLIAGDNNGK